MVGEVAILFLDKMYILLIMLYNLSIAVLFFVTASAVIDKQQIY
jgi:hypothetical protein